MNSNDEISNESKGGKFHDPLAYWRRLFQLMAAIPVLFLAIVGTSAILQHNKLPVEPAIALIIPTPFLVCAYFGIGIRELSYYWGYVLRGNVARNWGYVYLLAYFVGVAMIFWFLSA